MSSYVTFKQWLKQFRRDLFSCALDPDVCGFRNINAIASAAGLTWQTVENMRTGKTTRPSMNTIRQLCIATGTDFRIVSGEMMRARRSKQRAA